MNEIGKLSEQVLEKIAKEELNEDPARWLIWYMTLQVLGKYQLNSRWNLPYKFSISLLYTTWGSHTLVQFHPLPQTQDF